jgi:uncharacterized Zn finger protein (UPF0148 family)
MPGNISSLICPVCGKDCGEGWPKMSTRDCFKQHMTEVHSAACSAPMECKVGELDCPICGEVVTREGGRSASEDMKKHFEKKHEELLKKL